MALLIDRRALVSSSQLLAELADVVSRDKFVGVKRSRVASFLSVLSRGAVVISVKHSKRAVLEDAEDDTVLSTALVGRASYIVSDDRHLLDLGRFQGVRIVTVEEMLRVLT